jgi:hypothetical protein
VLGKNDGLHSALRMLRIENEATKLTPLRKRCPVRLLH